MPKIVIVMVVVWTVFPASGPLVAADLTFEERAAGIAAVERLRASWRLGSGSADFERDYPNAVWPERSADLETVLGAASNRHGRGVVEEVLDHELERVRRSSRDPRRLHAIQAVLGHDPATLRECLVLPRVAHRLEELIAGAPISRHEHATVWTGSEAILWGGARSYSLPPGTTNSGARCDPIADSWTATTTTGAPSGRYAHSVVWTGSEMIV